MCAFCVGRVSVAVCKVEVRKVLVNKTFALSVEVIVVLAFGSPAGHSLEVIVVGPCMGIGCEYVCRPGIVGVVALCCRCAGLRVNGVEGIIVCARAPLVVAVEVHGRSVAVLLADIICEIGLQKDVFGDVGLHPSLHTGLVGHSLVVVGVYALCDIIVEQSFLAFVIVKVAVHFEPRRETPYIGVLIAYVAGSGEFLAGEAEACAGLEEFEHLGVEACISHVAGHFVRVILVETLAAVVTERKTVVS